MRDDFSQNIIEKVKMRASFICSNPDCRALTLAPSEFELDKVIYIGTASHICAASPKGPRYDKYMTSEQRGSLNNAIFLCTNCSVMIDKNEGKDFSIDTIKRWKKEHEAWVRINLNKSISLYPNITNSIEVVNNGQNEGIIAQNVTFNGANKDKPTDLKLEHDINLFDESEKYVNEEILQTIEDSLKNEYEIPFDEYNRLINFVKFFEPLSKEYIHQEIETKKKNLISEIYNVFSYVDKEYYADYRLEAMFINVDNNVKIEDDDKTKSKEKKKFIDIFFPIYEPPPIVKLPNAFPRIKGWRGELIEKYAQYRRSIKANIFI